MVTHRESIPIQIPEPGTIPACIRAIPAWVCWRYEWRGGKQAKPPLRPDGSRASTSDPATWTTFEAALAAARRNGWGVGWVLPEGWIGVDLDDVIEDGRMAPWAEEIIRRVDGWAEISPSGAGAHIIVRGGLPGPSRKDGGLEIYAGGTGQYLTVTGRTIWPTWPADRTEAVAQIYQQHFGPQHAPDKPEPSTQSVLELPAGGIAPAGESEVREALLRLRKRWPWGDWQAVWAGETVIGRHDANHKSQSENHFAILLRLAWVGYGAEALARLAKACPAITAHPKAVRPDYIWRTAVRAWNESKTRTPGKRRGKPAEQQTQPFRLARWTRRWRISGGGRDVRFGQRRRRSSGRCSSAERRHRSASAASSGCGGWRRSGIRSHSGPSAVSTIPARTHSC